MIALATAWRTQVRAANRSLMSGSVWDEPMAAPDSLRALRKWFLLPWMGRLALAQTATKLSAGVVMELESGAMTACKRVGSWDQGPSSKNEQHTLSTNSTRKEETLQDRISKFGLMQGL